MGLNMFANIAAMSIANSIIEMRLNEREEKRFEESLKHLPSDERVAAREKRRLEKRADRQHEEICDAIRASGKVVNNNVTSSSYTSRYDSYGSSSADLATGIALGSLFSAAINND